MKISAELLFAYRETSYCIRDGTRDFVLRIAQESEEAKLLLAEYSATSAVFVTAWNPYGEVVDNDVNREANIALKNDLDRMGFIALSGLGVSSDSLWSEDSYFVLPVTKEMAIDFCERYKQNAVVFVAMDGSPELVFHPKLIGDEADAKQTGGQ